MSDPSGPTRPWGAMKDWVETVSSRMSDRPLPFYFMTGGPSPTDDLRMMTDTVHTRLPDIRLELERFNEERARLLAYQPIDTDSRMPLPRSGVGGDVAE